jgi:hypothetical protein
MAHADWIIDLGPGAGRIVFKGTPRTSSPHAPAYRQSISLPTWEPDRPFASNHAKSADEKRGRE